MFRAFNRLWRDFEDAFDQSWAGWPQDWPELEAPFRPPIESDQPAEPAAEAPQAEPAEAAPAAPQGYQRFYSHQTSFHRDADGTVKSWAEGTERRVHPSGAATETHTRRMGDKLRVTKRKKPADSEDWQVDSDSIRYAQRRKLAHEPSEEKAESESAAAPAQAAVPATKPKESDVVEEHEEEEPDFDQFDQDWDSMMGQTWGPPHYKKQGKKPIEPPKKKDTE